MMKKKTPYNLTLDRIVRYILTICVLFKITSWVLNGVAKLVKVASHAGFNSQAGHIADSISSQDAYGRQLSSFLSQENPKLSVWFFPEMGGGQEFGSSWKWEVVRSA